LTAAGAALDEPSERPYGHMGAYYVYCDGDLEDAVSVAKKITVDVPEDLLREAQAQTGEGISGTVRRGLQLLAAAQAFKEIRSLRGKVKFSKSIAELKDDET
jgi:Arc/MetJ-type ribon-helix-helix transcriptional regulator